MLTIRDISDRLSQFCGENSSSRQTVMLARQAAREAIYELANAHNWSYNRKAGRIQTSASYSTGTITYDETGGTNEREVTLASGTWPTWAAKGIFVYNSIGYVVDERVSDTVITLEDPGIGSDVAAGTSYTALYRMSYDLPLTFIGGADFNLANNNRMMNFVSPEYWHYRWSHQQTNTGQPYYYTIIQSDDTPGRTAIKLYPYPDALYNLDYLGTVRPKHPQIYSYSDNTVTVTADSTTVTGNSTAFTSRMVGSVLRISEDKTNLPTGLDGDNPYDYEGVIASVASATSLRVKEAVTTARTSVKYVISDPVDIEPGTMENAFMRCAEKHMAILKHMKRPEIYDGRYREALTWAMSADSKHRGTRRAGQYPYINVAKNMPLGSDQT